MSCSIRSCSFFFILSVSAVLCFASSDDDPVGQEPDWSAVTGGNWSPWVTATDGTQEWNPVASFNAWMDTIPEEKKAWALLADARYGNDKVFEVHWSGLRPDRDDEWDSNLPVLSHSNSKKVVDQLKEAFGRQYLGCPMTEFEDSVLQDVYKRYGNEEWLYDLEPEESNPSILRCYRQYLTVHTVLTRFVVSYAMHQLLATEADEFVELVGLAVRSSRFGYEYPDAISQLVSIAICTQSVNAISWAVEHHAGILTEEHLVQLDQIFEENELEILTVDGDVLGFHDACRRMANNTVGFNIQGLDPGRAKIMNDMDGDPLHVPFNQLHSSVQETMLLYEKMMRSGVDQRLFIRSPAERTSDDIFEAENKPLNLIGNTLIKIIRIAVEKAAVQGIKASEEQNGTRLAIAVHRHKLRHGEFPTSIDEIDPDLLRFEPKDAYTGNAMSYRLTEAGPLIYSFGPDLDDDQGQEIASEYRRTKKPVDGDYVLFPQP
jgi:hypothetical protein